MTDRFIELECMMRRKHVKRKHIADGLGLSVNAISVRMRGKVPWALDEAYKILDIMGLPQSEIFNYFPPDCGEND